MWWTILWWFCRSKIEWQNSHSKMMVTSQFWCRIDNCTNWQFHNRKGPHLALVQQISVLQQPKQRSTVGWVSIVKSFVASRDSFPLPLLALVTPALMSICNHWPFLPDPSSAWQLAKKRQLKHSSLLFSSNTLQRVARSILTSALWWVEKARVSLQTETLQKAQSQWLHLNQPSCQLAMCWLPKMWRNQSRRLKPRADKFEDPTIDPHEFSLAATICMSCLKNESKLSTNLFVIQALTWPSQEDMKETSCFVKTKQKCKMSGTKACWDWISKGDMRIFVKPMKESFSLCQRMIGIALWMSRSRQTRTWQRQTIWMTSSGILLHAPLASFGLKHIGQQHPKRRLWQTCSTAKLIVSVGANPAIWWKCGHQCEHVSRQVDKRYFFTVESPNNKGRIKQRLP